MSSATVPMCRDDSSGSTDIRYPEGESHGFGVYIQLDDANSLYETLTERQRGLNNERGENGTSDNPHNLGRIDASWVDGARDIGFYSSGAEYGEMRNGSYTQFYEQCLTLYEDVERAKKANTPAKRSVKVHKRDSGLTYKDGNDYSWPEGWRTGHQYEGTCIEIQGSYAEQPGEVIADAFELLEASDLLTGAQLREAKSSLVTETGRFHSLETHHRFHTNHETDVINTLRDSERLVSSQGTGQTRGVCEQGHHQIWGFRNTRVDFLGFDTSIEWQYKGETYTDIVQKHHLKCYRHKSADEYPESHPLAHPKIEVKTDDGGYPLPAWDAVKQQIDAVLNAHTADFAGVPKPALIEDEHHDGSEQDDIITESPADYRVNLQDYFKSTGFKKEVVSLLVNNRSKAAKDILYTLIRRDRPLAYDELKEEVGLTKRTIRKWVRRMEDIGILSRQMDACMFVRMSDFVREHLRGFIDKLIPVGDTKRKIQKRRQERIESREGTETDTDSSQPVATDGGVRINAQHERPQRQSEAVNGDTERTTTASRVDRPPD
jgi:DNA-binding HxlR family transcriptional regulator